jgi:[ribosomal protein S18]-alanine N-acetyltransferase
MIRARNLLAKSSRLHFIRQALKKDVVALRALEDRVFDYDLMSRRSIAHAVLAKSQSVLILETVDRSLAGAAYLHYRTRSRQCRLYSIAIDNELSGHGLGTYLLQHCEQAAKKRGCIAMRLELRADRTQLRRFYARNGFQANGLKTAYYDDGTDAISMFKIL